MTPEGKKNYRSPERDRERENRSEDRGRISKMKGGIFIDTRRGRKKSTEVKR